MILYRDIGVMECRFARGGLCRNTPNCIVTEMKAGELCRNTLSVSWQEQRLGCLGHDTINCIVT